MAYVGLNYHPFVLLTGRNFQNMASVQGKWSYIWLRHLLDDNYVYNAAWVCIFLYFNP